MKVKNTFWWLVRASWPLLGGVLGAWLGFGGYLRLPPNADSFAMFFSLLFFSFFACVGLLAGMLSGVLIGGLAEQLLRRFGAQPALALGIATIVNALVLWLLVGLMQTQFPGLRAPDPKQEKSSAIIPPQENACAHPPAENSRERMMWESECR